MKKVLFFLSASLILSISTQAQTKKPATTTKAPVKKTTAAPAAAKPAAAAAPDGKALLAKSDCLACHKEQQKVIGPAYADVAQKYEATAANIDLLTEKVIKGGSGVWGAIPMSPHPTLSQDDAKAMVKYILSIKKE